MDTTTRLLTGMLPGALLVSALLTYPIARVLLFLYKRSVRRSMAAASNAAATPAHTAAGTPPSITLAEVETREVHGAGELYAQPWRTAAVYAAAGVVFAAVLTAAWLLSLDERTFYPVRTLFLFWMFFWPAVLAINVVVGTARRRLFLIAGYFAIAVLIIVVALRVSPELRLLALPLLWLASCGIQTLVTTAYLSRQVRAIGPLVLAFLLLAFSGALALTSMVAEGAWPLLEAVARKAFEVGFEASHVFWALLIIPLIAFAFIGWHALKWVGRQYERKRFSDEMLTIDAIQLLFAMAVAVSLTFHGIAYFFTGFVAFAAFKAATYAGFALASRSVAPRSLLLLRAFTLGSRSERLFDVLRAHWLRVGNITLIAGPDLITRTIEPHELLRFLGGEIAREFVTDEADLNGRLARLDTHPDPDGRFRVNDFFCHANTWQPAMRALALRSDAVLMDLRGFTQANQGCVYELGELLNLVDLERLVLLVDATTDRAFLSHALRDRWSRLSAESINRKYAAPQLCIVTMPRKVTTRAIRQLFAQLYAGCSSDAREPRARTAPMISSAR
jgi:hypothetical protein